MGDTAPSSTSQLLGLILRDGRYVTSGVLGRGSQGATLEGVDKREGRLVAIKRFQVRGARSWKDVELAEREARVLSQLSHRLLPHAIEHFEEEGALYLVMERIEGETLASIGTMDRDEVVRFLHCVAEILDYLHSRSPPVIHRDIKPSNAIRRPARAELDEHESAYVLVDFGSVRDSLKPAGGSTVVGTFGYMAPEQFQGRARPASDVYAVGVCALRMLTGVEPEDLPHKGLSIDVAAALGRGDPAMVRTLTAMVEPDPDKRAASIKPLLAGLTTPAGRGGSPAKTGSRGDERKGQRQANRQASHRAGPSGPPMAAGQPTDSDSGLAPIFSPSMTTAAVLGLTIAEIAVWAALNVAVPLLLTLMSVIFGRGMRRAAAQVRIAGRRARAAIRRARSKVRTEGHQRGRMGGRHSRRGHRRGRQRGGGRVGAGRSHARPPKATQRSAARQRIQDPEPTEKPKARIEDPIAETLGDMEDALDEAIEDFGNELRKPPRKGR